jgi:hypothetical protein
MTLIDRLQTAAADPDTRGIVAAAFYAFCLAVSFIVAKILMRDTAKDQQEWIVASVDERGMLTASNCGLMTHADALVTVKMLGKKHVHHAIRLDQESCKRIKLAEAREMGFTASLMPKDPSLGEPVAAISAKPPRKRAPKKTRV